MTATTELRDRRATAQEVVAFRRRWRQAEVSIDDLAAHIKVSRGHLSKALAGKLTRAAQRPLMLSDIRQMDSLIAQRRGHSEPNRGEESAG